MTNKRRRFSADFKAKVALEAIKGEQTVSEIAAKHAIHPTMISGWKRQAIDGMSSVFDTKTESAASSQQSEVDKLHSKIGQLVVERDFLSKAFKS